MNEDIRSLKDLLRTIRTERGLSLREFSELLNISHAYLNKLEKGIDPRTGKKIIPTMDTITKIANGLNVPLEKFLSICGYLGDESNSSNVQDPSLDNVNKSSIAVEDLLGDALVALKSYKNVTLNGESLSYDQLNAIIKNLESLIRKD